MNLKWAANKLFVKAPKRAFDIVGAAAGITVLAPLLLLPAAIAMGIEHKTLLPFKIQKRVGKDLKPFWMIKLQTMSDKRDEKGNLLPDDLRTSKMANKIRISRADEVPQFLHVIFGQMSLVGPRPPLVTHKSLAEDEETFRDTRPGITGLPQLAGQNELETYQIHALNREYRRNRTLLADFMICAATPYCIYKNRKVKAHGEKGQLANTVPAPEQDQGPD